MVELTVFIVVKIPNLKASSKLILKIVNKQITINNDKMNIITERKYLFISFCSILESIKLNLLAYILLGLEYESISLIEYLNKKYIFKSLIPELVEKKEPPITTIIKNTNHRFVGEFLSENPIFDILLVKEKSKEEKL
tara:strand:+ start:364 stop:777 length:414 start_codon:yes stop_codon:yes gene_type:complete